MVAASSVPASFVAAPRLRNCWYPVASSVAVEPGPLAVRVLGESFALWRDGDGHIAAAPDRCPHREAKLSRGEVVEAGLACPYHGWTFAKDGTCVRIPSAHQGMPVPPRAHLGAVHVCERYGLVWLAPDEPESAIPEILNEKDPQFRRINTPVETWQASTTRMVDNFLDITHFPYVHRGTLGPDQDPVVPRLELEDLDEHFHGYAYDVKVARPDGSLVERHMTTGFSLPFVVRSTIEYEDGLTHVLLLLSTPIDDETSYFTFVVWRNDDFTVPADQAIAFDTAIGAEDRRMLEQFDGPLPLDQTALVSVQADKTSVEWRRRFVELLASH